MPREDDHMIKLHEDEREYRYKDHGTKYLLKSPRLNFGAVRLRPGDHFEAHKHEFMEETIYVVEGSVRLTLNGVPYDLVPGDFVSMQPGEVHFLDNVGDVPCKYVISAAPPVDGDKVLLEEPEKIV